MNNSVIAATLIVGGTTALRVGFDPKVQDKASAYGKIVIGGFVFGALLTMIASGAPNVANALAVMLIVAALLLNLQAIMSATNHVFK